MKRRMQIRTCLWGVEILVVLALLGTALDAQAQFGNILKKATEKADVVQKAMQPMTLPEERDVGREVAVKAIAFFHVYPDPVLTRYVNLVGTTVAAQSERKDVAYRFAVLDSDSINAFSAPGGFVFITRGALAICEDESELAGVLAHEVGHIAGRHVLKIFERDKAMRAGMEEAKAYTPGSAYLQKVSKNILVKLLDQGLAPGDEFDADQRGIRYAHAAGYPADGLQRFLAKLDQATQQGGQSFWTRTHPPVPDRNTHIQQTIAVQHWEDVDRPKVAHRFVAETKTLKAKG